MHPLLLITAIALGILYVLACRNQPSNQSDCRNQRVSISLQRSALKDRKRSL